MIQHVPSEFENCVPRSYEPIRTNERLLTVKTVSLVSLPAAEARGHFGTSEIRPIDSCDALVAEQGKYLLQLHIVRFGTPKIVVFPPISRYV